jgi:diguanylate cyclase (GGDEF)-like protein/PAS domain S-box-containing protein
LDFGQVLTFIFILGGAILMVMSVFATRHILTLLAQTRYLVHWRILLVLILFFLAGYLISLAVVALNQFEVLIMLTGVIYLFGALFVFNVVRLGQRTISDLFTTTVSKDYVESIIKAIPDVIIVANQDYKIQSVNEAAIRTCGYTENELLAQPLHFIFPGLPINRREKDQTIENSETNLRIKDGRLIPIALSINTLVGKNGQGMNYICLAKDITQQKKVESELEHEAFHDPLTDLANRAMLIEKLEYALDQLHQDDPKIYGILFIDLDHFKDINDHFGHILGDSLLVAVARKLEHCVRREDLVSRLGGDEFVILLTNIYSIQDVEFTVQRVLHALEEPFDVAGKWIHISGSIGYLMGRPGLDQAEVVLRNADMALYQAKAAGRNCAIEFVQGSTG